MQHYANQPSFGEAAFGWLCCVAGERKWLSGQQMMVKMMAKLGIYSLPASHYHIYFSRPHLPRYRLLSIFLAGKDKMCLVWFSHNWFSLLIKKPRGWTDEDTKAPAMQLLALVALRFDTKTYQKKTYIKHTDMPSCYYRVSNGEVLIIRYSSKAKVVFQQAWHAIKCLKKYIWKDSKHQKWTALFGPQMWASNEFLFKYCHASNILSFTLYIFKSLNYP